MGSFNGTCVLTNLPIHVGDPVVVYFLNKVMTTDSNWFGPHAFWDAWGLPIRGIYNDYGFIETAKYAGSPDLTPEMKKRHELNARFLAGKIIPHPGEDMGICKPVTPENLLNIEDFQEMIWRDNLSIKTCFGDSKIHYAMVHEKAHDELIKALERKYTKVHEFIQYTKSGAENVFDMRWNGSQWEKDNEIEGVYKWDNLDACLPHTLLHAIDRYGGIADQWMEFLIDGNLSDDEIKVIGEAMLDALNFHLVMRRLRKVYLPLHDCTQAETEMVAVKFGEVYNEICYSQIHRWDEDEED